MPGHLLDGLCIGEAGRIRGKAELALERLPGMLLLNMSHSLSLNHLSFVFYQFFYIFFNHSGNDLIPTEVASLSRPRSVCSTIFSVQPSVVSP